MMVAPVQLSVGAGRYRLESVLGRGGMGVVWAARDTHLNRRVALKEIRLPPSIDDEERGHLRRRVLREARAAARLHDPGVVGVYDIVDGPDQIYIVMELVDAPSLAELVRQRGPLPPRAAARIGSEVLDALGAAHAQGIVHRDVKPANVLVPVGGRARLTDFGIASIADDAGATTTLGLIGSPSYMSPEQAMNEAVSAASDLWSLGATLYYAVEGEPPFGRGEAIPTLTAIVSDDYRPMHRAGALAPVLASLLVKVPAHRPDEAMLGRRLAEVAAAGDEPTRQYKPLGGATPPSLSTTVMAGPPPIAEPAVAGPPPIAEPLIAVAAGARALAATPPRAEPVAFRPAEGAGEQAMPDVHPAPATKPSRVVDAHLRRPRTEGDRPPVPEPSRRPLSRRNAALVAVVACAGLALPLVVGLHSGGTTGAVAQAPPATSTEAPAPSTVARAPAPVTSRPAAPTGGSVASTAPPTTTPPVSSSPSLVAPPSAGTATATPSSTSMPTTSLAAATAPLGPAASARAPAGWVSYSDPATGFNIAHPPGWTVRTNGTLTDFADPVSGDYLRVDHRSPPGSPTGDWYAYEPSFAAANPGYRRIQITPTTFDGYPAGLWEYTYAGGGTTLHAVDLGFAIGSRYGFALNFQTRDSDWAARQPLFATLERSFQAPA